MAKKESNLSGRVSATTRAKAEHIAGLENRKTADWVRLTIEARIAAYEKEHGEIKLPPVSSPL